MMPVALIRNGFLRFLYVVYICIVLPAVSNRLIFLAIYFN